MNLSYLYFSFAKFSCFWVNGDIITVNLTIFRAIFFFRGLILRLCQLGVIESSTSELIKRTHQNDDSTYIVDGTVSLFYRHNISVFFNNRIDVFIKVIEAKKASS